MEQALTIYLSQNPEALPDYAFGQNESNQLSLLSNDINRDELYTLCKEQSEAQGNDFSIAYKVDGVLRMFRGRRTFSAVGSLFTIRTIPSFYPDLSKKDCEHELNMPDYYQTLISQKFLLKGGLVLVSGRPGNGKSTTVAASIVERLKVFGGIAITLEDPIEYPMTGKIGKGVCYQLPLNPEKGFDLYDAIHASLRMYPSGQPSTILSVGEVRDAKSAALLLREAKTGHLCFSTLHANDVKTTLARILDLASEDIGENAAREALAESLRMVVHQELVMGKPKIQVLVNPDSLSAISAKIRAGDLNSLIGDIRSQNNKLYRNTFFKKAE